MSIFQYKVELVIFKGSSGSGFFGALGEIRHVPPSQEHRTKFEHALAISEREQSHETTVY